MGTVLRSVNRVLLGLVGLGLTGLGLAVLMAALDLPRRLGFGLPSGWSWREPGEVLLTQADRTQWRDQGWWWPVVFAVLAALVVLSLWWVLAQARRPRLSEVLIESEDGEDGTGALLRGRALEDVLAADAESLPGVDRAQVTLVGRRTEPRVHLGLLLEPHAAPGDAVQQLRAEVLEPARTSTGLAELPAEVRLRSVKHRAERVS
ncbi:alkaline shock response membrane anchor protein AmaP [Streptomyces gobiensis]|uniref:alkaline shock response membrane anchor protein AmaP n=1 Tax=Streptomyces gobiensis TaxID=2875706 RepID=UPI001E2F9323|nr:alkaline shock response membrane anchor protein AmaP [Streptomyces gobiensis]UGY90660.1 alkaline shock response membrane anchor protein AmaP [Streptomyces gobiensis]